MGYFTGVVVTTVVGVFDVMMWIVSTTLLVKNG